MASSRIAEDSPFLIRLSPYQSSPPCPFSNPALLPEFHLHRVVGCGCRLGCLLTPPTPVRASRHVDRHHLHHL
ncbi:unnamed protein product [Boreogadus saida]